MTNKNIIYVMLFTGLAILGCDKKQSVENKTYLSGRLTPKSSKVAMELARNTVMINLDKSKFIDPIDGQLNDDERGKIRAVVYRFYKHVKVENGKLTTDLKSGEEINISDDLFNVLYKDISTLNRQIDSLKDKGIKFEVPPITEDYLNGIINNNAAK